MRGILKQSLAYFFKNKLNVIILCILTTLTSFMYFFVEASIDGNILNLSNKVNLSSNEYEYLTGLSSNKILATSFLIGLTLVTCFVYYMFYKKNFDVNKKVLGCYRALGFTKTQITLIYIRITFILAFLFLLVGLAVGYYYSYILLETYQVTYGVSDSVRGISFSSFFVGVLVPTISFCIMPYLASRTYRKPEVAILFSGTQKQRSNSKFSILLTKISKFIPSKYSFSSKVALRKPFNLFLILVSVYFFLSLIVLSFSLNMSSSQVLTSQTAARNYNYEVKLSKSQIVSSGEDSQYFFSKDKVKLYNSNREEITEQQLVALDNNGKHFKLVSNDKEISLGSGEVAVNARIAQIYKLKEGDEVQLSIDGKDITLRIKTIAENGDYSSIYINRAYYNGLFNQSNDAYNGFWSNTLSKSFENERVLKYSDYLDKLQNNNVSNRLSAVINQILACVFGILLIFLVLLLNFQDNFDNFISLRKLGYLPKEIKAMLINIYLPLILITFLLMIIPSIYTSEHILNSLSLQTGDYMPFVTNIFVFCYAFGILIVLYVGEVSFFGWKLKKIFKRIENG